METGDRGRGNRRGGGRGRGGPHRRKSNRNAQNNSQPYEHNFNTTGTNNFPRPHQFTEGAGWSNPVNRYEGQPQERDGVFDRNLRYEHGNPNQSFSNRGGQNRGARRKESANTNSGAEQYPYPVNLPQYPPAQYPYFGPGNHPRPQFVPTPCPPRFPPSNIQPQSNRPQQDRNFYGNKFFGRANVADGGPQKRFNESEREGFQHFNQNPLPNHRDIPSPRPFPQYMHGNSQRPTPTPRELLGARGISPGLEIPRKSSWNSETNLHHGQSMESLNSERSLKLNTQDQNSNKSKRNQRNNRKQKKDNLQNDFSNPFNADLTTSADNRPLSRSSVYSNEPYNIEEGLEFPKDAGAYDNKPAQFRGRGRGRARARGHFTGTDKRDDRRPSSRNSCHSNSPYNDLESLNLPSQSGFGVDNLGNRNTNFRGRGKGHGSRRPGTDQDENCVSRPLSRSSSCSNEQYNTTGGLQFDVSFNADESNQRKQFQNARKERGKNRGQNNTRQTKETRKNKPPSKPDMKKSNVTAEQLEMIKQFEPEEIIQILSKNENEYSSVLQDDHDPKVFILIIDILSKVCQVDTPELLQKRAEIMRQASLPAFTSQLFNCVTEYPYFEDNDILKDANQFFENVISLYETLSEFMPSASSMWHNHVVEVQKALKTMSKNPKIELNNNLLNTVKYLLDEIGQNVKKEVREERGQEPKKEKETYFPEPVGDFRTVSLYPRPEDIYSEQPFLFPNIIKGPYRSVEHYLDIHYKLLREDFMSPIRQAMRDYRKQRDTNNRFKRVDNVRIYRRVKFLHSKTVMDTVGYEVCFDVDNKMNRVNWEFSNRFMYGSLLLFSNDDFDSFFMATVANRNVKDLENKLVTVELVESVENVKSILGKEFIMAESEAYFNPYFHVLKALTRFDESNFPLAEYIVHAQTETNPPRYLNFAEIYLITMAGNNFTFRVLSDIEWPTHEQLGLDQSQYSAFRAALTNDLTVIQGPPGTGKTFLGLKIAQALLANAHVWNQTNTPIFVVCFTNHALDQFLEGLLPVTNKLVRIGGKSKGGELDKFNIRERRREYSYYKKVQGREMRELKLKMSTVFADIQVYQASLKALENTIGVVSVNTLRLVMSQDQRDYFSGDEDFMDWLLQGVAGAKNKERVKITITADRGIVREAPQADILGADTEDLRVKQAFFDTIDLDTDVGPSEDTITVQFACDMNIVARKKEELEQQLNRKKKMHKNQLIQTRNTKESLDVLLTHLRKELIQSKKLPRSELEREKLFEERYLRNLNPDDRWRLYHTWVNILRDGLVVELGTKDKLYKEYSLQYEKLRLNDDLQILKTANVVGTTTTLAAKFQPMFEALGPRIVIVEEAAEVLEAHIIASLSRSCQHLILIGDHKQLRPSVAETRMARQYQLDVSLFERLVLNEMACHTLTLQHRMRPEVSRQLVPTIYEVLRDDPSVLGRDNIKGMDKNVFFMTHNNFEDEVTEITSKRNRFEAEILLGLAKYLVQQGYKPQEITILATYKGQMYHMKNEIKNMTGFPKGIQITVVDNFQGEENRIILLSLVRSNAINKIGFLEIENRICVALSRARDGMYIVGNMDCLVASSKIWVEIKKSLVQQHAFGPSLNLRCQIHPEQMTRIESGKDFSKVSEGGCSRLCGQQLSCLHFCKSMCHVEQDYHLRYKCKEPCMKVLCYEGHLCPKKCNQKCGQCQVPMSRQLACGHHADLPCSMDIREHACKEPVQVVVPLCRHTVTIECHARLRPECNLPCPKRLECGHSCEMQCHENDDPDHIDYACFKPCARLNKNCSLDHKCPLTCFEECKPCPEMVVRELPCGHSLKLLCSADLNTVVCQQKCRKTLDCMHDCTKKCFQQCRPCLVPVEKTVRGCGHKMTVDCGTAATRQICTGRCPNTLDCNHPCSKRCMDVCSSRDCEVPVIIVDVKPSLLNVFSSRKQRFPLPCGHSYAHVPCNKRNQVDLMTSEELMQYCNEPCGMELTCKHVCGGTCSQCMQGRIHKMCNEQCGNVLICGHSCKVPCREVCPPCKEPCRHECKHSKCSRKCGEECVPCKEPCDYACKHERCSRRCGEMCDRQPCYEPCLERLHCGHSCVGFCGEPCPPCRKCEPKHFEEIFFTGEETEEDSRWVLLVDCGHTLESTGLEMWLNIEQEQGEIGCKACPRCKTPIVKVQRFMNLIKQTYVDIQRVKAQCFGKRDEIKKERAQALRKIQNLVFISMPTVNEPVDELEKMYNELAAELPEVKGKKRNTIDAQKLRVLCFWTEFFISLYTRKQEVWSQLDEERKRLLNSKINFITRVLMKRSQKISEQEMQGFECEVRRIRRIADLFIYISSAEYRMASSFTKANVYKSSCEKILFSVRAYDDETDRSVKVLLGELKKEIKSSAEVSPEEISMINKAMSSSFRSAQKTGHWFKCKNGHVYCITECGGAMEEAHCPVRGCDARIGGQHHRLRDDQHLAPEMDGARHAAWSDANNMANFGFNL